MAILLIEDDENNRELIKDLLTFNGYSVLESSGGREGIHLLQTQINIELVICDWLMAGVTGLNVLAEVKKMASVRKIPFVMLTAYAGQQDQRLALSLGADEYITKPFEVEKLLEIIRKFV